MTAAVRVLLLLLGIVALDALRSSLPLRLLGRKSRSQLRHLATTIEREDAVSPELLPTHQRLVQRRLENGFTYIILPNTTPADRFEAHLEVLSGSAHELERQQGMAHLLEHVAYMGSPKRQLISGTGSRTNAYTDFHHTVFFAACPTQTPGTAAAGCNGSLIAFHRQLLEEEHASDGVGRIA